MMEKRLISFWEFNEDCKHMSWPTCKHDEHPKPYNFVTNPNPPMCDEVFCPIWGKLDVVSDKAYFVSWDEYMQHQHEMIEESMQRMAEQMLEDLKTAPHYPTEGTFWKNKEK